MQQLVAKVQQAVDSLERWCCKYGQKISSVKTKAMYFSNSVIHSQQLTRRSIAIEYVKTYKFLGAIFDSPTLRWKPHIESIKNKCMISISIMKSLSNYKWGSDKKISLRLYVALIYIAAWITAVMLLVQLRSLRRNSLNFG